MRRGDGGLCGRGIAVAIAAAVAAGCGTGGRADGAEGGAAHAPAPAREGLLRSLEYLDVVGGFGRRVVSIGDIDGRGVADLVVSASGSTCHGLEMAGAILTIAGEDGALLRLEPGATRLGMLGHQVAALGDVDGDGAIDWIGSTRVRYRPGPSDETLTGATWIAVARSGRTGEALWKWPTGDRRSFTMSVAVLADCDGDGARDVGLIDGGSGVADVGVTVLSGASGAEIRRWKVAIPKPGAGARVGDRAIATQGWTSAVPPVLVGPPRIQEAHSYHLPPPDPRWANRLFRFPEGADLEIRRGAVDGSPWIVDLLAYVWDEDADGVPEVCVVSEAWGSAPMLPWRVDLFSGRTGALIRNLVESDSDRQRGLVVDGDVDREPTAIAIGAAGTVGADAEILVFRAGRAEAERFTFPGAYRPVAWVDFLGRGRVDLVVQAVGPPTSLTGVDLIVLEGGDPARRRTIAPALRAR